MKYLALTFSLAVLFPILATAQSTKADDASAVKTTVRHYIEAYYTGDAHGMEQTLHPHYLKHVVHGNIPMREMTGAQIVQAVRLQGTPTDLAPADRTEQVTVLDIAGDIASAKLVTPHWTDYLTLLKSGDGWKIVSVVQSIGD